MLDLRAVLCLEVNPLDEVLRQHRVRDRADLDRHFAALAVQRDDRHVLLSSRIDRIGDEFLHRLAAAAQRAASVLDEPDDVPTFLTYEKTLCHKNTSPDESIFYRPTPLL